MHYYDIIFPILTVLWVASLISLMWFLGYRKEKESDRFIKLQEHYERLYQNIERHYLDFILRQQPEYSPQLFDVHPAYSQIVKYLHDLEQKTNISLTPSARQLILLPIYEYFTGESGLRNYFRKQYTDENIMLRRSIDKIVNAMIESPSESDRERGKIRSTTSVIKGFWKGFCSIPPFCSERDER